MYEADVFVEQQGFDFELSLFRNDGHQRLGGGDHGADGVYRQLLHSARYRGSEGHVSVYGGGL